MSPIARSNGPKIRTVMVGTKEPSRLHKVSQQVSASVARSGKYFLNYGNNTFAVRCTGNLEEVVNHLRRNGFDDLVVLSEERDDDNQTGLT